MKEEARVQHLSNKWSQEDSPLNSVGVCVIDEKFYCRPPPSPPPFCHTTAESYRPLTGIDRIRYFFLAQPPLSPCSSSPFLSTGNWIVHPRSDSELNRKNEVARFEVTKNKEEGRGKNHPFFNRRRIIQRI